LYKGWKIYTYNRKIPKTKELTLKNELRARFNSEDFYFSENTHKIVIFYGPNKQEINVSFQEVSYSSERNGDREAYHIVFESVFFGYRAGDERAHQELQRKIIQRLPWKKLGFWLQDDAQIPIPKSRLLQVK
jgi:hypothetical protein